MLKKGGSNWVEGDRFFDREGEIRALTERVRDGDHTLVTAQRRMGKTSLVRELLRQLDEGKDFRTVFVDLEASLDPGRRNRRDRGPDKDLAWRLEPYPGRSRQRARPYRRTLGCRREGEAARGTRRGKLAAKRRRSLRGPREERPPRRSCDRRAANFAVKQIPRFRQKHRCAARALLRGRQKHARPTLALRTATGELPRMWPEVPPHSRRLHQGTGWLVALQWACWAAETVTRKPAVS